MTLATAIKCLSPLVSHISRFHIRPTSVTVQGVQLQPFYQWIKWTNIIWKLSEALCDRRSESKTYLKIVSCFRCSGCETAFENLWTDWCWATKPNRSASKHFFWQFLDRNRNTIQTGFLQRCPSEGFDWRFKNNVILHVIPPEALEEKADCHM